MDPYRRRFVVLSGSFSLADTLMPQPFMRLARILQPCNPAERLWKDCGIIIYDSSPIELERRVRGVQGVQVQRFRVHGSRFNNRHSSLNPERLNVELGTFLSSRFKGSGVQRL